MAIRWKCPAPCRTQNTDERRICRTCSESVSRLSVSWTLDARDGHHDRHTRGGLTKATARKLDDEIGESRARRCAWEPAQDAISLGQARDKYLDEAKVSRRGERVLVSDLGDYRTRKTALVQVVEGLGEHTRLDRITHKMLNEYQDALDDRRLSPSWITRQMTYLNGLMVWAQRKEWIAENPVPLREKHGESRARDRILTLEEYRALRGELSGLDRALLALLTHLPLRVTEALSLTWDMIDLGQNPGAIRFPEGMTKSGRPRVVPLWWPITRSTLEGLTATRFGGGRVFEGLSADAFRNHWDAACKKLGITGLRRHDCKRTAIVLLLASDVPEWRIEHASDHASANMRKRYGAAIDKFMMPGAWGYRYNGVTETIERQTHVTDQVQNPIA